MNKKQVKDKTKISWQSLTFMAFAGLWGFGNVANGFMYFNGIQVIFSWILMFALYFVPYALMVGELGSTFKNLGGGVSSWVEQTSTTKLAYYAGWTYWAVHVPYIASKGSGALKALSWLIFHNAEKYDAIPVVKIQIVTFILLLIFTFIASRGLNPLKNLTRIAGSSMFVLGILYIILGLFAPAVNPSGNYNDINLSLKSIIPTFNVGYFTSLSILVFAVGGVEKISPYINKMEGDPSKEFPKAMIVTAIMVVVSALFGTIAMGRMFDPAVINASQESLDSYVANGAYWAFQKLGEYYGLGNFFLIIYALANLIGQLSVLLLSIDAPLRILLADPKTSIYVPNKLLKKNKYGAYINGIKLVFVLSGAIVLFQIFLPGAASVLQTLTKLNAVTMPLRYLWVFLAYYLLKKKGMDNGEYKFTKSQGAGKFWGLWCFIITLISCVLGIYSPNKTTMILNILTPLVLIGLGLIFPAIRAKEDKEAQRA